MQNETGWLREVRVIRIVEFFPLRQSNVGFEDICLKASQSLLLFMIYTGSFHVPFSGNHDSYISCPTFLLQSYTEMALGWFIKGHLFWFLRNSDLVAHVSQAKFFFLVLLALLWEIGSSQALPEFSAFPRLLLTKPVDLGFLVVQ